MSTNAAYDPTKESGMAFLKRLARSQALRECGDLAAKRAATFDRLRAAGSCDDVEVACSEYLALSAKIRAVQARLRKIQSYSV